MSPSTSTKRAATMTATTTPAPSIVSAAADLLRDIASRYTRFHKELKVNGRELGQTINLTLQGHRDDHPKLVGSQGKHIWALQQIFAAAGRRAGRAVRLTLLEPSIGEKQGPSEFVANHEWTPDATMDLLSRILAAASLGGVAAEPVDNGELTTLVIKVEDPLDSAARWATGELGRALHLIFHAIGRTEGRQIHVEVFTEDGQPIDGPTV